MAAACSRLRCKRACSGSRPFTSGAVGLARGPGGLSPRLPAVYSARPFDRFEWSSPSRRSSAPHSPYAHRAAASTFGRLEAAVNRGGGTVVGPRWVATCHWLLTSSCFLCSALHSTLNFRTELLHPFWHSGKQVNRVGRLQRPVIHVRDPAHK
jgi:hypothetical protein